MLFCGYIPTLFVPIAGNCLDVRCSLQRRSSIASGSENYVFEISAGCPERFEPSGRCQQSGNIRMTAKAERRMFFSIARIVCHVLLGGTIVLIPLLWASIITSGEAARHSEDGLPISAATALATIPGTQSANAGFIDEGSSIDVPNAEGIPIPNPLNAVLTSHTNSQSILNGWLDDIPVQDRRAFVDGLASVITAANQHSASWEWDNRQRYIGAAMSAYARMNIERITQAADARKLVADRLAEYRDAMGTLLGVAAMLTLLLTVMAIERNTRPRVDTVQPPVTRIPCAE